MAIFSPMYQVEYRPAKDWEYGDGPAIDRAAEGLGCNTLGSGFVLREVNSQRIGTVESFTGAVLDTGEMNYHDDSDFYAVVYDAKKDSIYRVEYATTRFSSEGCGAGVDATEEVKAKAEVVMSRYYFRDWLLSMEASAAKVEKGKEVVTTTTRGKNKGRAGIVKVRCAGKAFHAVYSEWAKPADRVLVEATDGGEDFWIDVNNLRVADPGQYVRPMAEGRAAAATAASYRNWRYVGSGHGLPVV